MKCQDNSNNFFEAQVFIFFIMEESDEYEDD